MTDKLQGVPTAMKLNQGEEWLVQPNRRPGNEEIGENPGIRYFCKYTDDPHTGQKVPVARLLRVGWLDQRGQVWTEIPSGKIADEAGCGSFTPLLVDNREDSR
jgi:hypothetical protein